jgi:hypothetical protein
MINMEKLATELTDAIIAYLSHKDVIHLSQTCHSLRAAAIPVLFHTVSMIWDGHVSRRCKPVQLLSALLQNAALASYIKCIELRTKKIPFNYSGVAPKPRVKDDLDSDQLGLFTAAINAMDLRCADNYLLTEDSFEIITTLLIYQCSNLRSLTLAAKLSNRNEFLAEVFQRLHAPRAENPHFENLSSVTTEYPRRRGVDYHERYELSANLFKKLFSLPTMRNLDVAFLCPLELRTKPTSRKQWQELEQEMLSDSYWSLIEPPISSHLTSLHLTTSSASGTTIRCLLQQTPSLESFRFECAMPTSVGSLNLREVKRGLDHVRSTLQCLWLSYELYADESAEPRSLTSVSEHSLGSFREYEQLTTLSVSLALVFGEIPPAEAPPLADIFPPHLKKWTVREDLWDYEVFNEWQVEHMKALFEAFIMDEERGCKTATPDLEHVVLDQREIGWTVCAYWGDDDETHDVAKLYEDRGIACTILAPYQFGASGRGYGDTD